ncbi:37S ribosomal protein-like protein [Emericellopsis cladophorae]|uniref:Small ribosomal subunit protein uS9m n=1 Tax=Emericellopsis cladophorae TaxID=2686198 RepID=A0A9Q0BEW9_9HYPO|nr:37S ribosomal protein-like protein [Emericellopsis cladophorae]KAI6782872.1 37S ribosomal protein-like protein [Emericellopsis cladophorae]
MASFASSLRHIKCHRQLTKGSWQTQLALRSRPASKVDIRQLSTTEIPSPPTDPVSQIAIPFQNVSHARQVPKSPSYFSREPRFNDLHLKLFNLLSKYNDLPTLKSADAPQIPWLKLELVRHQLGEEIKASHFSQVMRIARRLNLIEPSVRPPAIDIALRFLSRSVDSVTTFRKVKQLDKHGRAVGVGKRKASTARAFVVEGTGEVFINGKPLNEAFGRIHDRESAIWALTSTQRMDKYNVWAIVRGGGTTGQAEAMTMAVADGLVAHEPALKTALRAAGCITRDPRTVERKKHGQLKARKGPAWVKR